jgi:hypothetical protein
MDPGAIKTSPSAFEMSQEQKKAITQPDDRAEKGSYLLRLARYHARDGAHQDPRGLAELGADGAAHLPPRHHRLRRQEQNPHPRQRRRLGRGQQQLRRLGRGQQHRLRVGRPRRLFRHEAG